jgi:lipid II isoglutaminyl synthase (glutamine-hydrolysing)
MRLTFALLVARAVRFAARLRGGGSAVPGLVLLKMVPDVLEKMLGNLPLGVVFVTGSNGKTTTTTMLTAVLREHGLRVFTNPAGGNLPQGLASALVQPSSLTGRVKADIAVLEVDEAYGAQIAQLLTPDWVVFINLQIDQLNRMGEPERVFGMLQTIAKSARAGIVINRGDPNLAVLGDLVRQAKLQVHSMDVSAAAIARQDHGLQSAQIFFDAPHTTPDPPIAVLLDTVDSSALVRTDAGDVTVELPSPGLHYATDAALAIAAAQVFVPTAVQGEKIVKAFENQAPVYGRGETIDFRGQSFYLTMMKNLPSLQANLSALKAAPAYVWISVDEGTPDKSWIFDVDLGHITKVDVLSGAKAYQWALALEYRGIAYGEIIPDTKKALERLVEIADGSSPVMTIVNYQQNFLVRRLAGYKELEGVA